MNPHPKLSAVIIAKDEERTIGRCLDALLQVTDDIQLVLDTRSCDATAEIAEKKGVRVIPFAWQGYSAGKNAGASYAKNDWILCPDADEVLSDALIQSLRHLSVQDDRIYLMNIQTWFGTHPVQYCGWYPDWNIRLYNRQTTHWSNDLVHEKLVSEKPLIREKIAGDIEHFSFENEGHMIEKYRYYAQLRAEEWVRRDRVPPKIKRWFGPVFRFFRTYFLKLGFLDGKTGWIIAKNEYRLKRNEWVFYDSIKNKHSKP